VFFDHRVVPFFLPALWLNLSTFAAYLSAPFRLILRIITTSLLMQDTTVIGSDLKKAGLKVTLPRLKVLEVLERAEPRHMSAEDVYKQLINSDDTVGLATVYRVLTQFESAGIVSRHNFDDGHAVYELANEIHHDHMVDVDSGNVIEFVSEEIEKLQHKIAEEHGFDLVHHELVLYVRKRED
jgi:Fur family ferric uptake transcriptional regulator